VGANGGPLVGANGGPLVGVKSGLVVGAKSGTVVGNVKLAFDGFGGTLPVFPYLEGTRRPGPRRPTKSPLANAPAGRGGFSL